MSVKRTLHESTTAASPLKVLIVVDGLGSTGGDRWLYELAGAWRSRGTQVSIFHLSGAANQALLSPPEWMSTIAGTRPGRRIVTSLPRVAVRLARASRSHDILVVSTMGIGLIAGYVISRLTGTLVVAYSQGLADESLILHEPRRYLHPLCRWCLVRVDGVFCISEQSIAASRRMGVSPRRLYEVRTGIDILSVESRRQEAASVRSGVPLIVAAGTILHKKGFDRVILALSELHGQGYPARLVIIGPDGGEMANLKHLVDELDLADSVDFLGFVDNPVPLIDSADVFVHAARSEVVGLVLLEALIVGTPVIAHDCVAGGPRLVLAGGQFGRLVDAGEAGMLAEAIMNHLKRPEELRARAERALPYIRANFSVENAADASLHAFGELRKGSSLDLS